MFRVSLWEKWGLSPGILEIYDAFFFRMGGQAKGKKKNKPKRKDNRPNRGEFTGLSFYLLCITSNSYTRL